jgi:hypothetical protein
MTLGHSILGSLFWVVRRLSDVSELSKALRRAQQSCQHNDGVYFGQWCFQVPKATHAKAHTAFAHVNSETGVSMAEAFI